jgi:hypothetical protein
MREERNCGKEVPEIISDRAAMKFVAQASQRWASSDIRGVGLAGSTISGARTDSPFQNKRARAEGGLFSFLYLSLE